MRWRYLSWVYIKYFIIIFLALELFYVGIDTLMGYKHIPSEFKLQLYYISLTALNAINYILPLSVMFAFIMSFVGLVRANEFVSFFALGASKFGIVLPAFLISVVITLVYIGLNFTDFSYARYFQKNINKGGKVVKSVFLKESNKLIFIGRLDIKNQIATQIRIFEFENGKLKSQLLSPQAKFGNKEWQMQRTYTKTLNDTLALDGAGFVASSGRNRVFLHGFKPKTLENMAQASQAYNIRDAVEALKTAKNSNLDKRPMYAAIYTTICFPFFAPFLMIILYYRLPLTARFFNLALLSFILVLVTLLTWGLLYLLITFVENRLIAPELGIIAPIVLLAFLAVKSAMKNR